MALPNASHASSDELLAALDTLTTSIEKSSSLLLLGTLDNPVAAVPVGASDGEARLGALEALVVRLEGVTQSAPSNGAKTSAGAGSFATLTDELEALVQRLETSAPAGRITVSL